MIEKKLWGKSQQGNDIYIHKMNALAARKMMVMYPSGLYQSFKEKDYSVSHAICLELLAHAAVDINGNLIALSTDALINNHVEPKDLMKLEKDIFEYTFGFFPIGDCLNGLQDFARKVEEWAVKTAMDLSQRLSQVNSQP